MRYYILCITVVLISLAFYSCNAQTAQNDILSQKVTGDAIPAIKELMDKGYIHESDKLLMANFLISHPQINNLSYAQLIDSINEIKHKMVAKMARENNFGKDSMFIRIPNGEKFFLGLGELSFDKLVEKYSDQLPQKYEGDYNLVLDGSTKSSGIIAELCNDPGMAIIVGNILYVKKENGQLNNLRVGDVAEMSKRIRESKEFAPFLKLTK